jgi:hypothetical protein
MSYPILKFNIKGNNGESVDLRWFPSEYLYREKSDQYCLAAEKYSRSNEIMLGGTLLR